MVANRKAYCNIGRLTSVLLHAQLNLRFRLRPLISMMMDSYMLIFRNVDSMLANTLLVL